VKIQLKNSIFDFTGYAVFIFNNMGSGFRMVGIGLPRAGAVIRLAPVPTTGKLKQYFSL